MMNKRYVVALPNVNFGIEGYDGINLVGVTLAPTPQRAVGNLLHRQMSREYARLVQAKLRDCYGGSQRYAIALDENPTDSCGNPLHGVERVMNQEIAISTFLEDVARETRPNRPAYEQVDLARTLIEKFLPAA